MEDGSTAAMEGSKSVEEEGSISPIAGYGSLGEEGSTAAEQSYESVEEEGSISAMEG